MKESMVFTVWLVVALCSVTTINAFAQSRFQVAVDKSGSYKLLVNNNPWLISGDTFFNDAGKTFSSADKSLELTKTTSASGRDMFGEWKATELHYLAGKLPVTASFKTYIDGEQPVVIFTQTYMDSAKMTSAKDKNQVISSFPSLNLTSQESVDLGYLSYAGDMTGYAGLSMGSWKPGAKFVTGIGGGPVVLFDHAENAIVISPMSQFMAASNANLKGEQIAWGIMGLVDSVPKAYSISFIAYYSDLGINQALQGWGNYMRAFYGKSLDRRLTDPTINYLGYWSDNGAYYYYHTEKGKNYEDTILDTVAYINKMDIPFKYLQFDSWWYVKGISGGTVSWTTMDDVFPNGFSYLSEKTKLPFGCHNRYWDIFNKYAKYNGGKYNFIPDNSTRLAVPDDDQFWVDLFNITQQWGNFILYEQDWLNKEVDENQVLLSDLDVGRRWLVGMGKGAAKFNVINIQYCMAYSREIMQSLEIPVVTQARVSGDYHPGGKQWNIGISSMFADAMGIAPFKDTLWSTTDQPDNPYKGASEPYTRLNQLVSTLSTGPVGPGDGIGYLNKSLIMRCCDADGLILKPSKPATAIDEQVKREAFGKGYPGPDGELWTTYSNVTNVIFGIILAAGGSVKYPLVPSTGWTGFELPVSMVYSSKNSPKNFDLDDPLVLGPECTLEDFCLYYTSPVIAFGESFRVLLLGEMDKWVPMSSKRFTGIQIKTNDVLVYLNVKAKEKVSFTFQILGKTQQTVTCDNSHGSSPVASASISISEGICVMP